MLLTLMDLFALLTITPCRHVNISQSEEHKMSYSFAVL
jgi:hypothetical protein